MATLDCIEWVTSDAYQAFEERILTETFPIDVWSVETLDPDLLRILEGHADVIFNYLTTLHGNRLEREASNHTMPYPENSYASEFIDLTENVMQLMKLRTIRSWHYSRLTDGEVNLIRKAGVYPSSLDNIRSRFAAQVAAGTFTQEFADQLFIHSPYQTDQLDSRSGKFWMVSHPLEVDDHGVKLLLESWGGESAYFHQQDTETLRKLRQIGRPRVIEVDMPLINSRHAYPAAKAVVSTYGRLLGCQSESGTFDLYSEQSLGPKSILAVHSEGDGSFDLIGRGYPAGFTETAQFCPA